MLNIPNLGPQKDVVPWGELRWDLWGILLQPKQGITVGPNSPIPPMMICWNSSGTLHTADGGSHLLQRLQTRPSTIYTEYRLEM